MRFLELANRFSELEGLGRRSKSVRIVADLFDAATPAELEPIVYLLQGQLRPPYEGIELGVGERLLIRAVTRAYGVPENTVTTRLRRLGDLGSVAEALSTTSRGAGLAVCDVYDALTRVARATGAGSIDRKIDLMAVLLRRATPLEARYIVRAAQGRLRLGIGDATVLEATALGALGDRGKRGQVEHAYNVRSDLGGVVRLAYAGGARALARVRPVVGVPVRPALAQRLPSAAAIIRRLGAVQAEPKYDGIRLQLHRQGDRIWIFSRRLENVTAMFPELAAAARRRLRARRAIIEGEAVVFDQKTKRFLPFQVTMTRKRKHGVAAAARDRPVRLFAFDVLYADGREYLTRTQAQRRRRLIALLSGGRDDSLLVTEALETDRPAELQAYFNIMLRRGLEGVVAKRPDAPYRAGARGFDWVKLKRSYQSKLRDTLDVVLIGYLTGRGKRAKLGIGSLLAAVYDPGQDRFRSVAKIGSGPSEAEWRALRTRLDRGATPNRPRRVDSRITPDVWVEPKLVVEVLADEITRSPNHTCGKSGAAPGYALRFPRMLDGVRADKAPEDATTEHEVLEMYRMQRTAR